MQKALHGEERTQTRYKKNICGFRTLGVDIVASASSCYFTHVSILRISDCHILQMTLSIPICIAGDDCVEEPDQTSRMHDHLQWCSSKWSHSYSRMLMLKKMQWQELVTTTCTPPMQMFEICYHPSLLLFKMTGDNIARLFYNSRLSHLFTFSPPYIQRHTSFYRMAQVQKKLSGHFSSRTTHDNTSMEM